MSRFTLDALLKLAAIARSGRADIRCPACGEAGVANLADSKVIYTDRGPVFVHAACADDEQNWIRVDKAQPKT